MGGSTSSPVTADGNASTAVLTQPLASGCPVQHTSSTLDRTPQPATSECPAQQDKAKLQTSQCPVSAGSGCDSSAIDNGVEVLDPTNMVRILYKTKLF